LKDGLADEKIGGCLLICDKFGNIFGLNACKNGNKNGTGGLVFDEVVNACYNGAEKFCSFENGLFSFVPDEEFVVLYRTCATINDGRYIGHR
jgi:hypothetical protein